jgi:hypothetical protein
LYAELLADASFVDVLVQIDRALANAVKALGCQACGAVLDIANYERKARGPWPLGPAQCLRFGLCCRRPGCRKRVRPPSVRFVGQHVYLGVAVLLGAALRQGPSPSSSAEVSRVLGADRRTLGRWRRWWTERVGPSRTFEIARAELMPPPTASELPRSLLVSFVGTTAERVLGVLRFLVRHFGARFPRQGGLHAEDAR